MSGVVWEDQNQNGVQDAGEPPLPGISVTLRPALASGRQVRTDDSGYLFAAVAAGAYTVEVADFRGYVPTTPASHSINVPDGGQVSALGPIGLTPEVYLPFVQR